jgi:acetate kinase
MTGAPHRTLTVNSGSTSIKFALIDMAGDERRILAGSLDAIGEPAGTMHITDPDGAILLDRSPAMPDHRAALGELLDWLEQHDDGGHPDAIGHRVVHGGADLTAPVRITPAVLARLDAVADLAPDHLPGELAAIRAVHHDFPHVPQVAAFDTAFHRTIEGPAATFPLPQRLTAEGIHRYGFHGISCEYVLQELAAETDVDPRGRIVIAHLGGGASMTAVRDGRSIDTTMGLTPLGGLMMGTRCGDLDPGVLVFLLRRVGIDADELDRILNHESGLLGVSGISADMHTLMEHAATAPAAEAAIDQFAYIARKHLAALGASLGGLDTVVFTGGIGEHAWPVRQRICRGLHFIGIDLDTAANEAGATVITTPSSPVAVRVVHTDEELMIARHTRDVLAAGHPS